jgi:proteasome accessory factor A
VIPKKICGLETEYGITAPKSLGGDPTSAASFLISAYIGDAIKKISWDFTDEAPGNDARGFLDANALPPSIEPQLLNAVLTNGGRYYVDHAHPEYSTPECATVKEALLYDKAGEAVLTLSMARSQKLLPPGEEIVVYKNNSDGKNNSYGCHENYLVSRTTPFVQFVDFLIPHLVTRQIFCGAGKIGIEGLNRENNGKPIFQISQRADFFEEPVGLETTIRRPILNTRDEPHSDKSQYRRLHIITGDANLSEVATLLKIGTTAIVLQLIEAGALTHLDLEMESPVQDIQGISRDITLGYKLKLKNGRLLTALEMQWLYFEAAQKYHSQYGLDAIGEEELAADILHRWEHVLTSLEADVYLLAKQLDWVAKLQIVTAFCERHQTDLSDPNVAAIDLQYHDLRPAKSIFQRLNMDTLLSPSDVENAISNPPETTRAYFRGECLKRYPGEIKSVNWDSILFDIGNGPLQKVPMNEPLRGSKAHLGDLLEKSPTAKELLQNLQK